MTIIISTFLFHCCHRFIIILLLPFKSLFFLYLHSIMLSLVLFLHYQDIETESYMQGMGVE